jgi:acyl-CoA reductase-like NAD-dependent aldehyde dehydrogenase
MPTHARVRAFLENVAKRQTPITYQELTKALQILPPHSIHRVTEALEHLMEEDAAADRPFIAAPAIIDRDADLDRLIEPLVKGGYYHAGQVCVSVQRIYVHTDLDRAFLDRFATRVAALKVGDPILPEIETGPLIHPREGNRVSAWTETAVAAGARLIGGGRLSSTTLVPSIIVNPPRDAKVSTLEVFGPVTCIYSFTRLDDAIAAANSLPMAFQASIFTEDLRTAFDAAERLAASAVIVNDHTAFRTDWMPFAGRRQSGYGIGGIPWTMREMTEQKMIVLRI